MVTSFSFISDDSLRALIERDKLELDTCLENGLTKSTLVMAGSIIEAVLVDCFLALPVPGRPKEQVLKANLADLIEWAEQSDIISTRTKEMSAAIRGFRNLIHPGKEYRLREHCDINSATVARHLVEIIVTEVAANYANQLGYTANHALSKISLDPGCTAIFPDLIDRMSLGERIKLFRVIPGQFSGEQFELETVIRSLILLHDMLSSQIPIEMVTQETSRLYDLTESSTKDETMFYLRFYAKHLALIQPKARNTVITYLLSLLARGTSDELTLWHSWRVFPELGAVLDCGAGAQQLISPPCRRV